MPVRNAHFYAQNEGRSYPVDDAVSCVSDAGHRLPPDLICDLNLRWPSLLGNYAFIAAVASTASLVTVTIQAAMTPTDTTTFAPLAVVTVRKPLQVGRVYALQGQADGVGGWIVFGSGVDNGQTYSGRFSTPEQSRLTPRAARPYLTLPVSSVQAINSKDVLTGVVTLKASEPLSINKEERFLDGAYRDCIVFRLVDGSGADGFPVPAEASNISGFKPKSAFQEFAGPCAGRPESNTCGCPNPIQFINAVAPDCDGVVTIQFQGCAQVTQIVGGSGLAVACELGLVDACLPAQLPSSEGLLPSENVPANVPVPPDIVPPPHESGFSDSLASSVNLPFLACFIGAANELTTVVGVWGFSTDNSPTVMCGPVPGEGVYSDSISRSISHFIVPDGSYVPATASGRNVAVFADDVSSVYRKVTVECKLAQGTRGAKHNAQLIINYRPHATIPEQHVYYAAEINYDTQEFRLLRFNGTTFQTISPATIVSPGIQLEKWYRITAIMLPSGEHGNVSISVRIQSITDVGVTDVTLSTVVSTYQPSTGWCGIGTNKAISQFAYVKIEEEVP